jgi:YbgC/YbaW family acyl-CoA thioester hydrolase
MKIFETRITVRGYELDSYGHVNNAVYLQYFEQARWEVMRELNILDYFMANGLLMVVTESNVRYMREANLFDELAIETTYEKHAPYLVFHQKIRSTKTQTYITRAIVKTLIIDKMKIPQELPELLFDPEQNKTEHGKK